MHCTETIETNFSDLQKVTIFDHGDNGQSVHLEFKSTALKIDSAFFDRIKNKLIYVNLSENSIPRRWWDKPECSTYAFSNLTERQPFISAFEMFELLNQNNLNPVPFYRVPLQKIDLNRNTFKPNKYKNSL